MNRKQNDEQTADEPNPKREVKDGKIVLTYRKTKEQERIEETERKMQEKKGKK